MDRGESIADTGTTVEWRELSPDAFPSPIVRRVPYLEVKLEHPDLEPDGHGDRFFPDAVPYELDEVPRVFYWRPALAVSSGEPENWDLICATPRELVGIDSLPADGPSLATEGASGNILVVDGTVAGETTTSHVASYTVPELTVDDLSETRVELTVNETEYSVSIGERRRIRLSEQCVQPGTGDGDSTNVTPELGIRYPGRRELHHPAPGATYRLFPSFDLDFDEIPNPLPIPTTAGELDDGALATKLGVDLSERPYPERVLWQAFAHTAFDPHSDVSPEITRMDPDHIVLRTRSG
jgi:hypothetical protein